MSRQFIDYDVETELLTAGYVPIAVVGRVTRTTTTRDGNTETTTTELVDSFRHTVNIEATP